MVVTARDCTALCGKTPNRFSVIEILIRMSFHFYDGFSPSVVVDTTMNELIKFTFFSLKYSAYYLELKWRKKFENGKKFESRMEKSFK